MSRNNTGNPIGRKAFPDFEDNVPNLDVAVNSDQDTWRDRLGKSRLTWAGIEKAGTGDAGIIVPIVQQAVQDVIDGVDGAVDEAQGYAQQAETASGAAFVNADVYPDVAAGRADVANGEQFQVVEGDEVVRYRRDSASTQTEVARYPSARYVSDTASHLINMEYGEILDTAEVVPFWADPSTSNAWVDNGSTGYLIPAFPGETYEITANRFNEAYVLRVVNPNLVVGGNAWASGSGRRVTITARTTSTITIGPGEKALWVSGIKSSLPAGTNQDTTSESIKRIGLGYEREISLLSSSVENQGFVDYSEVADDLEIRTGVYVVGGLADRSGVSPVRQSFILPLSEGDTLSFTYEEIEDPVLWYWGIEGERYPIVSGNKDSFEKRFLEYTARENMTVRITSVVAGTVMVNGTTPTDLVDAGTWRAHALVAVDSRFNGAKVTRSFTVRKGDVVVITKPFHYGIPIIVEHPRWSAFTAATFMPYSPKTGGRFEWIADKDRRIALSGQKDSMFLVKRKERGTPSVDIDGVYDTLNLGEPSTVFLTVRNYIVKTEMIGGVDHIATSSDLGKTWKYVENTLGNITHAHMFSDGTLMLCTAGAIYWTDDYETLTQTDVYDENGSPLVATTENFYALKQGDRGIYRDGAEMYVWGDYILAPGPVRIWYSNDRGRTVKAAARFGVTPMGGQTRNTRHVHQVAYNEYNDRFYVSTGDLGGECMLLDGVYDPVSDTWDWGIIAWGDDFKWMNLMFDRHFTYLTTDITESALRHLNGLYRVPTSLMYDREKYEQIWQVPLEELGNAALARINKDPHGNMILSPDLSGPGRAWVSVGGLELKMVNIEPNLFLMHTTGPNYNGDVYVIASTTAGVQQRWLNRPTYNLTKALRNIGVPFMKGISMFDGEVTLAD